MQKINNLYLRLDEDSSGGLNFEEFQAGVMNIIDTIHLTHDDFDIITEHGKHLGPTQEFNIQQFQEMMKGELWRFSRRELNNVLSVSGDEQFRSIILMLKIMEASTRSSLSDIAQSLRLIMDKDRKGTGAWGSSVLGPRLESNADGNDGAVFGGLLRRRSCEAQDGGKPSVEVEDDAKYGQHSRHRSDCVSESVSERLQQGTQQETHFEETTLVSMLLERLDNIHHDLVQKIQTRVGVGGEEGMHHEARGAHMSGAAAANVAELVRSCEDLKKRNAELERAVSDLERRNTKLVHRNTELERLMMQASDSARGAGSELRYEKRAL